MERAYKRISLVEASNMLYFKNPDEILGFAKEVCFS
jgi:hypothetical protein